MSISSIEEQSLSEYKKIILRSIHVRRVTLAIFLVIAILLRFAASFNFPLPLIFSPLMWGLTTYPFEKWVKTRENLSTLHNIHFGFFILEILILTYLIHIIGGVAWIGVAYYLFSIIYANFFLPRKKAWFITFLAIFLFSIMSYAEYTGIISHWSLFGKGKEYYKNTFYVVTTILAGGFGLHVTTAYTVQIFADVFRNQNESLRQRESELEELWSELIAAREKERGRIARKLHDGLGQTLMGIKLKLDVAQNRLDDDQLSESIDLLDQAIAQSRNLSHQLRPSLLDELGLTSALREMLEEVEASTNVTTELSTTSSPDVENKDIRTVLFRAAQELVNNAHQHGDADHITVILEQEQDHLLLQVRDDGTGFETSEVSRKGGLGLKGIEENANRVGGDFTIQSQPGSGTVARLQVPLSNS